MTFRRGSQRHRLLTVFYRGERLTRFQAEAYGSHALNSLIADLERLGLVFHRRMVTVPTRWGADARVAEYWLADESYRLAASLLGIDPRNHPAKPTEAAEAAYRRASGG